jgi:hypothetical protein
MNLNFIDLGLILKVDNIIVNNQLQDEVLFLNVRRYLVNLLDDEATKIYHFGYAPDNTSDGQDELLHHGTLTRIIVHEKYVDVDLEFTPTEVKRAFYNLVSQYQPDWCTIIEDRGNTKTETTIELLYREVF